MLSSSMIMQKTVVQDVAVCALRGVYGTYFSVCAKGHRLACCLAQTLVGDFPSERTRQAEHDTFTSVSKGNK